MRRASRLPYSLLAATTLLSSGSMVAWGRSGPALLDGLSLSWQREMAADRNEDPPTWVARLNYIQGPVSFRPGEVDEWAQATLNYPLRAGDQLWVDGGGRAELHVGSSALRLGSRTALTFLNFSDQLVQLRLSDGSVELRVRHLEDQRFEIATPQGAVTISRPGSYRIDVDGDGSHTTITTRSGEAEVLSNGSSLGVDPGRTLALQGGDDPTYDLTRAIPQNAFETWCSQRDQREERSASVRYVGREMIGYEDLDDNGTWTDGGEYGPVWRPRVSADWAPYRNGHWAWVGPWGWTWVDDAPWGFAPFHYGRWARMSDGWGWIPGRVVARPVYAPALVVFVGGSGFSASMSFGGGGGVAWFPLGPREVYHPAYRVSNTYVQNLNVNHVSNVNIINVTNVNVTNITYANRTVAGAVTAVPHAAFVNSRSVAAAAVPISPVALRQAQVTGSTALVAPSRESVMARPRAGTIPQPPSPVMTRSVVSRTPPPPPPIPFAARQQANAATPGKPLDRATLERLRPTTPVVAPPVRSASVATSPPRPAREGLPAPKPLPDRVVPQPTPVPGPERRATPAPPLPRPAQERPAERPAERPVDRPVERPTRRPEERPVERPAAPPAERPVERPANRPPERPAERPVERPADRPAERPANRPAERPVERPANRPAAPPAERPVERPANRPPERPAERPADRPVERPANRPAERPVERPARRPSDRPVERPAREEKPGQAKESSPEPVKKKVEKPKKEEDRPPE